MVLTYRELAPVRSMQFNIRLFSAPMDLVASEPDSVMYSKLPQAPLSIPDHAMAAAATALQVLMTDGNNIFG